MRLQLVFLDYEMKNFRETLDFIWNLKLLKVVAIWCRNFKSFADIDIAYCTNTKTEAMLQHTVKNGF